MTEGSIRLRCLRRSALHLVAASALAALGLQAALAQQPPQQQLLPQQAPQPQQQFQPSNEWGRLPKLVLERQFAGPLQDTIVQRWRDPIDGSICYIYLPITAQHSPPTASGFVQYGPNAIGSISCLPAPVPSPALQAAPLPRRPAAR